MYCCKALRRLRTPGWRVLGRNRMEGKSKGDDGVKRKEESSSARNRMEVMQVQVL